MTAHAILASTAPGPAGPAGWIGHWSPRIGDPTPMGWATVLLYLAAAALCWWVTRRTRHAASRSEAFLWRALAIGLLLLAVNKQLDLQTALTELGRLAAAQGGWYDQRHRVQRVFIFAVGLAAIAAAALLLTATRRMPAATTVTALGASALLAFVVIRASSFHHVDVFIGARWWGLRGNWLAEVGGLLVILAGGLWRARARPAASATGRRRGRLARGFSLVFDALSHRPHLVAGLTALALLGAVAVALLQPARYRAAAVVRAVWTHAVDARPGSERERRRLEEVRRRALAPAAVARVLSGTAAEPRAGRTSLPEEDRGAMVAALKVEPAGVGLFLIECVAGDPTLAAHVPNALAALLLEQTRPQAGVAGDPRDPAALEAALAGAKEALRRKEDALRRWREASPAPGTPARPGGPGDEATLVADLAEAKGHLDSILAQWRAAELSVSLGADVLEHVELVRPAASPVRSYPFDRLRLVLLGLALGLATGIAAAAVAERRTSSDRQSSSR